MLGVDVLVGPRSEVQGSRIRHHDASRLQEAIASNEQSFAPFPPAARTLLARLSVHANMITIYYNTISATILRCLARNVSLFNAQSLCLVYELSVDIMCFSFSTYSVSFVRDARAIFPLEQRVKNY